MKITEERWKVAQKAEKGWWNKWKLLMSHELITVVNEYWSHYFKLIENDLKSENKILDIGCGPNGMINYIEKRKRYGLDSLIDFYMSNFEMPKDIEWIKGIGENIPFENACFDIVITSNTLDHSHQPDRMLKEINRVLRKGGLLVLTVNCYGPFSLVRRKIEEKLGLGEAAHPHCFTFWQIEKLLRKIRFHIRLIGSGVGDLGDYVTRNLAGREKKKLTLRPRFTPEYFVKQLHARLIGGLFLVDERLGYPFMDFLFIASKYDFTD